MPTPRWMRNPPADAVKSVRVTLAELRKLDVLDPTLSVAEYAIDVLSRGQSVANDNTVWERVRTKIGIRARDQLRQRLRQALKECHASR